MITVILLLIFCGFIFNAISQRQAFRRLSVTRDFSQAMAEANQPFYLTITVENRKLLPISFLEVRQLLPGAFRLHRTGSSDAGGPGAALPEAAGQHTHRTVMTVMPFQKIDRRFRLSAARRGRYVLWNMHLTAGDFLGFNLAHQELSAYNELVVPPARYDIATGLTQYGGKIYGDATVRRWLISDPVLTRGVREYTGREPQKAIHWPSSLRAGRLMVRQFDFTCDNEALIVLNAWTSRPVWDIDREALEKCLSLTRTIAEELEEQHIPYGLVTNATILGQNLDGQFLAPGTGPAHLTSVLEILGRAGGPSPSLGWEMLLRHPAAERYKSGSYQTYIFITPELPAEIAPAISQLHRRGPNVVVISLNPDNLDCLDPAVPAFVPREVARA